MDEPQSFQEGVLEALARTLEYAADVVSSSAVGDLLRTAGDHMKSAGIEIPRVFDLCQLQEIDLVDFLVGGEEEYFLITCISEFLESACLAFGMEFSDAERALVAAAIREEETRRG